MAEPHLIFQKSMNRSHLVPKQVVAHRQDGTSYTTTVYIDPSTGQTVQTQASAFDFSAFEKLKSDKAAAMKYLKAAGVTWNESPHEGVNWMRASMAAKKAAGASSGAQGATKNSSASKLPTGDKNTQKTQNSCTLDYKQLASRGFDKTDGKTKTKLIKTQVSKENFMVLASSLVSWDKHPNEAIDMMRASMAFSDWADTHSLDDFSRLTAGKTLDSETAALAAAAEAPQTANKAKKERKKQDTSIPIPEGASEREKRIIGLVNSINSSDDLDACKSVGILAEDPDAMKYLRSVLLPKAAEQRRSNSGSSRSRGTKGEYGVECSYAIASALDKVMKTMSKRVLKAGVMYGQVQTLDSVQFTSPRSCLRFSEGGYHSEAINYRAAAWGYAGTPDGENHEIRQLVDTLQTHFGTYPYIDPENIGGHYKSDSRYFNKGVQSNILSERKAKFNKDNDGFYRALQLIADKDPPLASKVKEMQDQYLELMELTGYNMDAISYILEDDDTMRSRENNRVTSLEMHEEVSGALKSVLSPEAYEKVYKYYTQERRWRNSINLNNVPQTVEIRNPDYNYYEPEDDVTNPKKWVYTFDISTYRTSSGKTLQEEFDTYSVKLLSEEDIQQFNEDFNARTFTPENREKVKPLLLSLFGLELRKDGKGKYSDNRPYCKPDKEDEAKDAVMTNLLRMSEMTVARKEAISALEHKFTKSTANGQGSALEGVLDFVKTGNITRIGSTGKFHMYDNWDASGDKREYTPEDLLDKIKAQTESIPIVPLEKCKKLKKDLMTYAEDRADKIPSHLNGGTDSNGQPLYDTRYDLIGGMDSGMSVWYNTSDGNESNVPTSHPLCDLMVENLFDLAVHSPSIRGVRVKTDSDVKKVLERALGLMANQTDEEGDESITRDMRTTLLKAVKCSLSTMPDDEYKDLQHRIKMDWDNRVHGGNSAFFYGAYKINNLEVRAKMEEAAAQMGEKPEEYYHGTSFGGTEGILGRTGGFSVNRSVQSSAGAATAGAMLGEGVYLAKKSSKSAQYFGGYNYGRYGRGTLFICDAVMGKRAKYNQDSWRYDSSFDTIEAAEASNSRGSLLNDEWAVRHADWVVPKILIDMENRRRV